MESPEFARMRHHEDHYWWYRGARELAARAIRKYTSEGPIRLLDAGCGTGGQLAHLAGDARLENPVGLDFAAQAVRIAAERGLGGLVRGSTMALPFRDGSFDVVTSIDVLYVRGVDDQVALAEIRRVLRPGGLIVLHLPAFEALRGRHDEAVHTRHRYRKSEVGDLLRGHGFDVLKLSYWNATLFPVMLLKRSMDRMSATSEPPTSDMSDLPGWLNRMLTGVVRMENRALMATGLPFGGSVFGVGARR